jgi:hypothetical protein
MVFILWVFNIGYLFQHLGTILQIRHIMKKRETEGVCVDTQVLFLIGALSRCIWITDTMLKDFTLTYFELLAALLTLGYTLYLCLFKLNGIYSISQILQNKLLPFYFRWYVIFAVSLVASFFFHPGNESHSYDIQMFVSLNIFVEAAGLIPQIYSVNSQKDSNIFSKLYLMCMSISRFLRLLFWFRMYMEDQGFAYLIIADVLHLFMVSGFVFSFMKNLNNFSLPTTDNRLDMGKKIF